MRVSYLVPDLPPPLPPLPALPPDTAAKLDDALLDLLRLAAHVDGVGGLEGRAIVVTVRHAAAGADAVRACAERSGGCVDAVYAGPESSATAVRAPAPAWRRVWFALAEQPHVERVVLASVYGPA